ARCETTVAVDVSRTGSRSALARLRKSSDTVSPATRPASSEPRSNRTVIAYSASPVDTSVGLRSLVAEILFTLNVHVPADGAGSAIAYLPLVNWRPYSGNACS